MIKHLKPFTETEIAEVRARMSPQERLIEDIHYQIEIEIQKYVFENNDNNTRKLIEKTLNDINKKVKFRDISDPTNINNGVVVMEGSCIFPSKHIIFNVTIQT